MAGTDAAWVEDFLRSWAELAPSTLGGSVVPVAAQPSDQVPELGTGDFLEALPAGYVEATRPATGAWDLWALSGPGPRFRVWATDGQLRARRAGWQRAELSSWLPLLESLGLAVVEAVPWHLRPPHGPEAFVDDLLLRVAVEQAGPAPGDPALEQRLMDSIEAALAGYWMPGILGPLLISAGLTWPEVNLLDAIVAFRRQVGGDRAGERAAAMSACLVSYPGVAAALVACFRAKHSDRIETFQSGGADEVAQNALSSVPDLAAYEALRDVFSVIASTVRTDWPGRNGAFALKLDSAGLTFLPEPRPWRETVVSSPGFEGVHLRFGPVARGGIRWSDRPTDLRTEILGLARAQVKKNSLIVPTGAKGGFALRPPGTSGSPGTQMSGRDAYAAFVAALLDMTDSDDPYLVVAPDKGTGSFSDLANEISGTRGFWLGDAFASGGSNGYDHRALGITAKGAWLAVQRHFAALGLDPATDELRVAGVGDMTGDVFGNAMLQSRAVHLVAAFDHRHVFVDPEPSVSAFDERLRLSRTPGSSWADYDLSRASAGAVVVPRNSRSVQIGAAAAAVIGLAAGSFSPDEVVSAVLRAPVDLLFFGGIGTFVKAPAEVHSEVDDRANDDVRIGSGELRARAVVEGANLAMTQRARIAYSRRGGRINTDFVDNAGGVAMSDREVNLKILLGVAQREGAVGSEERNALLASAAQELADAVLDDVAGGILALDLAGDESAGSFPAYRSLMEDLERDGLLNPQVETMPEPEELDRREAAGAGFARPELAVIVAFARSELARSLEASELAKASAQNDGSLLAGLVAGYFPASWRGRFGPLLTKHPLYPQLAASRLANEIVAAMGPLWAHELAAQSGVGLAEVAVAYWVASRIAGSQELLGELRRPGASTPVAGAARTDDETDVRRRIRDAVGSLTRWYLWSPLRLEPAVAIAEEGALAAELEVLAAEVRGTGLSALAEVARARCRAGEVGAVLRAGSWATRDALAALDKAAALLRSAEIFSALDRCESKGRWQTWEGRRLEDDLARACVEVAVRALRQGWRPPTADGSPARATLDGAPVGGGVATTSSGGPFAHLGSLVSRLAGPGPAMPGTGTSGDLALASLAVRAAQQVASAAPAAALVDVMGATDYNGCP